MRVHAQEQWPCSSLLLPIPADRLGDRENVILVECRGKARPAMPRCAKRDPLRFLGRIRFQRVIARNQPRKVYKLGWFGGFTRPWVGGHSSVSGNSNCVMPERVGSLLNASAYARG